MKARFALRFVVIVLVLSSLAPWLMSAPVVRAATTWIAQSAADDGTTNAANCPGANCRLRDAIAAAVSGDTITFASDMTIPLASQLTIAQNVTIDGVGHTVTISGNNTVRVFYLNSGITLNLQNITVANGYVPATPGTCPTSCGSGLYNAGGTVNMVNSTFSHNISGKEGGGIYNNNGGTVNVTNSVFSGNASTNGGSGGGIYNNNTGSVSVTNSTFSGNTSTGSGGGIQSINATVTVINSTFSGNSSAFQGGGILTIGTLTITNSTFASNSSGISMYTGVTNITNSTFANTSRNIYLYASSGATVTARNVILVKGNQANCIYDSGATSAQFSVSSIHNLADDDSCGARFTNSSDILLGAFDNYGGDTATFPLLPGSAAIDAGDDAVCDTLPGGNLDQRGASRVGTCDIGAFESQGFTLDNLTGTPQSTLLDTAFSTLLELTVHANNALEPVNGGKVTFTPPGSDASASITGSPATIVSAAVSVSATANSTAGAYNVVASAAGASSVNFALTNLKINTTTSLSSSLNPSTYGAAVTFTATPSAGTGTVTFQDNGTDIPGCVGVALSAGQATCAPSSLTVGTHLITAIYSGDTSYSGSTSSAVSQYVAGSPLDSTADGVYGQRGSFTSNMANFPSADSLNNSYQMAMDSGGNLYMADRYNDRVLYYPAGSTIATRVYGQGGDFTTDAANKGGISADSLYEPVGVALDSSGNLYVADRGNHRVLYYPAGSTTATRVYGQGRVFTTNTANQGGISADSLNAPYAIVLDGSDNLYVADRYNNRVLYYPAGSTTATRVYGQGGVFTTNTVNNGGLSANSLYEPVGVALDGSGNLYVGDYMNSRVLYFAAGSTTATRVYGQGGFFTTNTANKGGISADSLYRPEGVVLDGSGNLYVADTWNHRVLYYAAGSTTATRVYGQGGDFTTGTVNKGGISADSLYYPSYVLLDGSGNLYIADTSNNRVLSYPAGVTTATGVYGQRGSFTRNLVNFPTADSLYQPYGVTVDGGGNLYVIDRSNSRVLYYPAGSTTATRVYGQGGDFTTHTINKGGISADSLYYPSEAVPDSSGNLYVVDAYNHRVLYYPAGSTTATRVYGQGGDFTTNTVNKGGISADSLNTPASVALDSSGNLYVADYGNHRVLYYPAGSTTATRVYGQGGDFTTNTVNKGGISADSLYNPRGMVLDGSGNLYLADSNNHRVLYYPAGSTTATRVYGQGGVFTTGAANKGGISADSLYNPFSVTLDGSGNLYVADRQNNRVLYYPAGSTTATRVYGQWGSFTTGTANNGGISADSLNSPDGVALDSSENLYVTDYNNNRVLQFVTRLTVATHAATAITSSSATLNGLLNANYANATVTFEYGLTTAYGTSVAATPDTVTGATDTSVTADISGLMPATTYHFRVKGVNSDGTANGNNFTFTTQASTTTALTSNLNPSTYGAAVTFTATPSAGSGTVTFKDNGANIAGCVDVALSGGQATCALSSLSVGTHPITAVYSGDTNYNSSTSDPLTQVVNLSGVLYAATNGTTSGACNSWINACTLQTALARTVSGSGQEIWIKAGIHMPSSAGDRAATFQLVSGVALYGGFAGTESAREQRSIAANLTVLSGDLSGNDGADFANNDENSYHVVTGATGATLDGVTVSGGNANGTGTCPGPVCGAGLLNNNSSPTVTNVIFTSNSALGDGTATDPDGGGMVNWNNSSPTVTNVTFDGNRAGYGGGMYNRTDCNPTLINVTFANNSATIFGGGMRNTRNAPSLTHVTFTNNTAATGGALANATSTPTIRNSIFWGNTPTEIVNETSSVPIISDSVVQGGYAGGANIITADPKLGILGDYGGNTSTVPLLRDSSAIDAADGVSCPATDQRGEARNDLRCDVGAYELKYPDSPTVIRSVSSATATTFGPTLVGIQRDGLIDPGVITVTKALTWQTKPANAIDVYWSITPTVDSGLNLTLTLCYTSTESNGLNINALRFWRFGAGGWSAVPGTPVTASVGDKLCATLSGLNELSVWTLATAEPTAVTIQDFTAQTDAPMVLRLLPVFFVALGGLALMRRKRATQP